MKNIQIIAAGKGRNSDYSPLIDDFLKRLHWPLEISEITSRKKDEMAIQKEELLEFNRLRKTGIPCVMLDKSGKTLSSEKFAAQFLAWQQEGGAVQFMIGGGNGFDRDTLKTADLVMSFGPQVWPHMLARVMLIEQIYRAQQILAGHPYHKA